MAAQLSTAAELASSKYELGTAFVDCFEVTERTMNSITIRGGGAPQDPNGRAWDAILISSAKIDSEAGVAVLRFRVALFNSAKRVTDGRMPAPFFLNWFHTLYTRSLVDCGARNVVC